MQESQKPDNVTAVLKVFSVLETLAGEKVMSLADLAQKSLTSKSTAYRFLQTMKDRGYVYQEGETEKYGLTLKLFSLGAGVLNVDLVAAADKAMNTLSQATGEHVNLGLLDEAEYCVVYVHKYDSRFNLCMQSTVGKRNPLYSTALGKALLAWRNEDEVRRRLAAIEFVKLTPNTVADAETLVEQLRAVRKQGYADEKEEGEVGVQCMAVPVFDRIGNVAAAISLSFPVIRFDPARKADYVGLLHQAGRETSEGLGFYDYSFSP